MSGTVRVWSFLQRADVDQNRPLSERRPELLHRLPVDAAVEGPIDSGYVRYVAVGRSPGRTDLQTWMV